MSKTGFSPLDQLEKKIILMNTSKFLCSFESCQVPQAILEPHYWIGSLAGGGALKKHLKSLQIPKSTHLHMVRDQGGFGVA